jgi:hypothetical protein
MSFAFINMHLDIYRIIIIPHKKHRCFGNEEKLEGNFFMLRYERKEGKVFFASGSKEKFHPQQSRLCTFRRNKIYYKVCTNLHELFHNYTTKVSSEFFAGNYITATVKLQARLRQTLASSFFSFVILRISKSRIRKVQISRGR